MTRLTTMTKTVTMTARLPKKFANRGTGLATSGLALAAALATVGLTGVGCGSTGTPETETAASQTEGKATSNPTDKSLAGSTKMAGGEQIVPKAVKREVSSDDRADYEKLIAKYQAAHKAGKVADQCDSLSDAFGKLADSSTALVEARFNQGAVLQECGREDEAVRIWERLPKYGPAITNLGYVAWRKKENSKAESMFTRAVEVDPLHTIEARNNLAQILRDRAHRASQAEKKPLINQAVQHLRTVLALDSNNLQAFATLAFVYYDLNMLEMAKLVGNQAIKKGEEIATGKFDEEKTESGAGEKGGKRGIRGRRAATRPAPKTASWPRKTTPRSKEPATRRP